MNKILKSQKGFTLMELLVVIAILAILSTGVFVALNPVKRFQDTRNARRWSDVNTILTAIHESIVDTGGTVPAALVGTTDDEIGTCETTCIDLTTALITGGYLKSFPIDPSTSAADVTAGHTGYNVTELDGIVTVSAPNAEDGETIEVAR